VLAGVAGDGTELVQELPLLASADVGVVRRQGPRQVEATGLLHPTIVICSGRILCEANLPCRVGFFLRQLGQARVSDVPELMFYNRVCHGGGPSSGNVCTTHSTTRRTERQSSAALRAASVRRRISSTACAAAGAVR
jgi:hypothetical protein